MRYELWHCLPADLISKLEMRYGIVCPAIPHESNIWDMRCEIVCQAIAHQNEMKDTRLSAWRSEFKIRNKMWQGLPKDLISKLDMRIDIVCPSILHGSKNFYMRCEIICQEIAHQNEMKGVRMSAWRYEFKMRYKMWEGLPKDLISRYHWYERWDMTRSAKASRF